MNWRGKKLTDLRTIVELIAATTTNTGLTVQATTDTTHYAIGIDYSDNEIENLVKPHQWHGDWNYTIATQPKRSS